MGEVIRGGLQAIPRGQYEAAASIGLSIWTTILIALPGAAYVHSSARQHIHRILKDTSLVIVIGLFDLLGAAKAVIVDPKWVGFGVEVYLFAALVYLRSVTGFAAQPASRTRGFERG